MISYLVEQTVFFGVYSTAKEMKLKNIPQVCKFPLSVPTITKIFVSDVMDAGYMLFLLLLVTACIN